MNTPEKTDLHNMDRRSFLKVTMLASGALMIGVGCGQTASTAEVPEGPPHL